MKCRILLARKPKNNILMNHIILQLVRGPGFWLVRMVCRDHSLWHHDCDSFMLHIDTVYDPLLTCKYGYVQHRSYNMQLKLNCDLHVGVITSYRTVASVRVVRYK